MKRIMLLVLSVLVLALYGCSGASVKKDAMLSIKKVGLLSLTVEKVGADSANNLSVMQAVADYSVKSVEYYMKAVSSFKLVPYSVYANVPDYKLASDFSKSPGIQAFLKDKAETDPNFLMKVKTMDSADIAAAFGNAMRGVSSPGDKDKAIANTVKTSQEYLDSGKETMLAASNMPFLPYSVFNDKDPNTTSIKMGNTVEESDSDKLKKILFANVAALCKKLNLDAMLVVYVSAAVPETNNVRVISGNRVLGDLKMDMTMLMISRNGEIVMDLGRRTLDDLAPNRRLIPVHLITSMSGKMVGATAVDLKDAEGKVFKNFSELSKEAAIKSVNEIRKSLGEIK